MWMRREFSAEWRKDMRKLKRRYVTKLLFGQYAYQINLELKFPSSDRRKKSVVDARLTPIKRWLSETLQFGYRTRITWARRRNDKKEFEDICEFNLYIQTERDYNIVLAQYGQDVVTIKFPENVEIAELLAQGAEIEYRPHLYYHTYQYKLYLSLRTSDFLALKKQAEDNLRSDDQQKPRYKFGSGNIIYLNHEDLVMLKLSLGEHIKKVISVRLSDLKDDAIPDEQKLYITTEY